MHAKCDNLMTLARLENGKYEKAYFDIHQTVIKNTYTPSLLSSLFLRVKFHNQIT